jgi:hypothetical protein
MSSSERSFFVAISAIAVMDLLTFPLAVMRFARAHNTVDVFDWLPFATLFFATLYAWLMPIKLFRALDRAEPDLRNRMFRGIYSLSLIALLAVQTGLMLSRSLR